MKIMGTKGLSAEQINDELQRGGRIVVYRYCVSIVFMTFRRSSGPIFIRAGQSAFLRGLVYTLISLIFGWWGIPWGPVYTIDSIITNCKGGEDAMFASRRSTVEGR